MRGEGKGGGGLGFGKGRMRCVGSRELRLWLLMMAKSLRGRELLLEIPTKFKELIDIYNTQCAS